MARLPDIQPASAALLNYLNTLSGLPISAASKEPHTVAQKKRKRNECRKYIEDLSQRLTGCSWAVSLLGHTLEEVKNSQAVMKKQLDNLLDEANKFATANPKTTQLPNCILSLIAGYAFPDPISVEEALQLKSSRCKWAQIVLRTSSVRLDVNSFDPPGCSSFQSSRFTPSMITPERLDAVSKALNRLSPTKLDVRLEWSFPGNAVQTLVTFCGRWNVLSLGDAKGEIVEMLWKALVAVSCPNCPPVHDNGNKGCGNHIVLSSLRTFSGNQWAFASFPGKMKNVQSLTLTVSREDETAPISSQLANEIPLLAELTILWKFNKTRHPNTHAQAPQDLAVFPRLRRVTFFPKTSDSSFLPRLQLAFNHLDGGSVEDLSLYILYSSDPNYAEEPPMMKFLSKKFPSVKSLAFGAQPGVTDVGDDELHIGALFSQAASLEMLIPNKKGQNLFPKLSHLSVEMDPTLEGIDTLLRLLKARRSSSSLPEIRSLGVFEGEGCPEEIPIDHTDEDGYFNKVRPCVRDLTRCTPEYY